MKESKYGQTEQFTRESGSTIKQKVSGRSRTATEASTKVNGMRTTLMVMGYLYSSVVRSVTKVSGNLTCGMAMARNSLLMVHVMRVTITRDLSMEKEHTLGPMDHSLGETTTATECAATVFITGWTEKENAMKVPGWTINFMDEACTTGVMVDVMRVDTSKA